MDEAVVSCRVRHRVERDAGGMILLHGQVYPHHGISYRLTRLRVDHRTAQCIAAALKLKGGHQGLFHDDIRIIIPGIGYIAYHRLERDRWRLRLPSHYTRRMWPEPYHARGHSKHDRYKKGTQK